MALSTPLVSVLMPFYNARPTIAAAVRSILDQSYENWEFLLPDDGSTDGSREIVAGLADSRFVIWNDGQQKGLAPRLNECVARARGTYIARMDSDDLSYPSRLRAQLEYLDAHPEVDLVGTSVLVFGEDGRPLGKRVVAESHEAITARPFSGFDIAHPTWMGRAEWFRDHPYDASAIRFEDFELLYRTHRRSCFANVTDVHYAYREPMNGFQKRAKTRMGRVRHFFRNRATEGSAMFLSAAGQEAWKVAADALTVATNRRYPALRARMQGADAADVALWTNLAHAMQVL
jgi:glycosyltransferase involved in cell wall biosynthesis